MPLPAPAISAANRMSETGPYFFMIIRYRGECNSAPTRAATSFRHRAQWWGDPATSPHRRGVRVPGAPRARVAGGSGDGRDRRGEDGGPSAVDGEAGRVRRGGRRGGQRVPGLPPTGGVARAGRGREATLVRRRTVLGPAGARLR